ncbi:SEFIR domain-containing family protein [Macrococcoides canis]|uniref:SEFIR domain-containing family protein n=1 Tax=Macrococcoides canis TaxID=1855823 RepID=A0A0D6DR46_9STAP|nr:SEFIR domain-containing protein [Macrococcus canis]ARQ05724.1 SEFIR domain-containing family protein [Macrococcus canis]CDO67645.1 SEFIR domain-containing family protein [Macrococcus canis]
MKKKIFISYAWEENEDKKVVDLAEMLEEYKELEVVFDKWDVSKGKELPHFMEQGIQQSDFVLVICSKRYKENTDKRVGGSGYEARLMSDEILRNVGKDRFLPILLNEADKDSIPNFLKGRVWTALYHDKESKQFNNEMNDLLATIVGHKKKVKEKTKSVFDRLAETKTIIDNYNEIKILGIKQEEVTVPKMDGTRGSALYSIPFLLNQPPSREWSEIFVYKWDNPRVWSTMHRFGKARVVGDKIILDGTTIEEVKNYHRDTLIMCVEDANADHKKMIEKELKEQKKERTRVNEFEEALKRNIDDIKF